MCGIDCVRFITGWSSFGLFLLLLFQDGDGEMRVLERPLKARRGLANKLNQIGELTNKRRLQR